jgi:branched-chain amino acid aminotransferase
MFVCLNGRFVPAAEATVSVFDRSFLYGDGLFETVRAYGGRPFRWAAHLERLRAGAAVLRLGVPWSDAELTVWATELLRRHGESEAVLRLHVSRGAGRRGYSPRDAGPPLAVLTRHAAPAVTPATPLTQRLATATVRGAAGDSLARYKTANRLLYVVARAEAEERGADEALLLNSAGDLVETAGGNLFWWQGDALHTPALATGALEGVTRRAVLELARAGGVPTVETHSPPDVLRQGTGAFATNSTQELIRLLAVDGQPLAPDPRTAELHAAYRALVTAETGAGESVTPPGP